ncbi:hypothetical protein [Microcoleus sp. N3A4]|uniref:hypothetical protein n=1 Tax=Microcoleus sp. N3A4 TaxID=3055379 RepID=UPI002FD09299
MERNSRIPLAVTINDVPVSAITATANAASNQSPKITAPITEIVINRFMSARSKRNSIRSALAIDRKSGYNNTDTVKTPRQPNWQC